MDTLEVKYEHQGLESRLTEINQKKHVRFAFLTGEGDTLSTFHPLVKCRDYLSDVLHFKAVGRPAKIYGFEMTPETNKLNLSRTRMLISFPNGGTEQFIKNFEFIQRFEATNFGIEPAKLFQVHKQADKLVIDADPFWMNCTALVSLLTFLCRCSLYLQDPKDEDWMGTVKKSSSSDSEYLMMMEKFFPENQFPFFTQLDYKSTTPSGFSENADVATIHDTGGILSFVCRGDQYNIICGNPLDGPLKKTNFLIRQMSELTGI